MVTTERKTKKRRLEGAGYVHVSGWLRAGQFAARVEQQIAMHREDVERIGDEPKPRGRPKREAN
jgi:hypothetical protein